MGSRVGGSSGSTSTVGFSEQGDASLKEALGFSDSDTKKTLKKGAKACKTSIAKTAKTSEKKSPMQKKTSTLKKDATTFVAGKPWIKLFKTIAKDPARSYITGRQTLQGKTSSL